MSDTLSWVRPEERIFVRRIEAAIAQVHERQQWMRTDFLSQREQYLLQTVLKTNPCTAAYQGGFPAAERVRCLLMPEDWYPQLEDFELVFLRLEASGQALPHGAVLGSILGTGLERRKVGDILSGEGTAYAVVSQEMNSFLRGQLSHIGKVPVSVTLVESDAVPWTVPLYERDLLHVASLRLDAVLAQGCHLSRAVIQEAISRKQVRVNGIEMTAPDAQVQTGDTLSVRGYGRLQVYEVHGVSKSGRIRMEVGRLRSKQL